MTPSLVSILIPAFKPTFFECALQSAIHQTYSNTEIIISDDRTDNQIEQIVARYNSLTKIRYIRNPSPDGSGYNNLLHCVSNAQGEFIKFLFDDDFLMPFCVQYMVDAFSVKANRPPAVVVSERWFIDSANRFRKRGMLPINRIADVSDRYVERFFAIHRENRIGEFTTAMWRRGHTFDGEGRCRFTELNGQNIRFLVDVAMWVNMSRVGAILYIPLPLSCFRIHQAQNSQTRTMPDWHRTLTEWEPVIDGALSRGLITVQEARDSYSRLLRDYIGSEQILPNLTPYISSLRKKLTCMDSI